MNKKFKPEDFEICSGILDFKITKNIFWGILDTHREKPHAGIIWILREHGEKEKEVFLSKGDHLVIYDEMGKVVFDGTISPVKNTDTEDSYICVNWTQKGIPPEEWSKFFIRLDGEHFYRAVLLKKKK